MTANGRHVHAHLERRLQRGGVVVAAPEEDEVLRVLQARRKRLHAGVQLERLLDVARQRRERADHGETLGALGARVGAQEQRHHGQRHNLARVGLRMAHKLGQVACLQVGIQVLALALCKKHARRLGATASWRPVSCLRRPAHTLVEATPIS